MDFAAAPFVLMYVVLPMWLAAGFADYLCHRAAHIETTSGWKESLLHLLQFAEMAVPTLAAIFLEINAPDFLDHDRRPHSPSCDSDLGCELCISYSGRYPY